MLGDPAPGCGRPRNARHVERFEKSDTQSWPGPVLVWPEPTGFCRPKGERAEEVRANT